MQELDIAQKVLEDHEDVFADIVNGLLFQGHEVVKVTDLEGSGVVSSYKAEGRLRKKERDVAKYEINVFEMGYLTMEQVDRFRSDFKVIAEYFMHLVQRTEYQSESQELQHADEVLDMLEVMTGDKRFERMQEKARRKREEGKPIMKNLILDEAEERGEARGELTGQRKAWARSIRNMKLTRNISEEEAFEMLDVPMEEREKVREVLAN